MGALGARGLLLLLLVVAVGAGASRLRVATGRGAGCRWRASLEEGRGARVHEEKVPWREARAACEAEGAHLVVINSKAEAEALRGVLQEKLATDEEPEYVVHAGFYADLVTVT
ncbi:Protein of unknown function, partial [Gryllus bimaculatus]